jgi:glycosyltransferase involved in cell wall biosynthesis
MVSSLRPGGAEKHAVSLVNQLDTTRFRLALGSVKAAATLATEVDAARLESLFSLDVRRGFSWRAPARLARILDDHHIDVVVCTNAYSLLYAYAASWLARRRIRLVEIFHTTVPRTLKFRLTMILNRFLFRRCSLLVYVSFAQREYWRARGVNAARDLVIQNGIDTEHFTDRWAAADKAATRAEFGYTASDYVIGICAALRVEKAHGDLLQAVRRLRDSGVAAKVLIIGDGVQRAAIEEQIAALGLRDAATITGYKIDVRPYVAACDAMALVSHSVETFSIAALESMSLGKPIVMTDIGGAREQVTHGATGFLFEPGDIAALTQHLGALADRELRQRMGNLAAQTVREKFTVRAMLAAYDRELLGLCPAPVQLTTPVAN